MHTSVITIGVVVFVAALIVDVTQTVTGQSFVPCAFVPRVATVGIVIVTAGVAIWVIAKPGAATFLTGVVSLPILAFALYVAWGLPGVRAAKRGKTARPQAAKRTRGAAPYVVGDDPAPTTKTGHGRGGR